MAAACLKKIPHSKTIVVAWQTQVDMSDKK